MFSILKHYPLTLLCIITIWTLCLITPPSTGVPSFSGFDKVCHVVMYFGTCSVLWWERFRCCGSTGRGWMTAVIVLPILMSCLIEIVQGTATETRSAEWFDVAANAFGTLLAAAAGHFVLRRFFHRNT